MPSVDTRFEHHRRLLQWLSASPMLHDMSLTERYAVIYDLPVVFNLDMAMSGASLPYAWDPDHQARIGLLPREGDASDCIDVFGLARFLVPHIEGLVHIAQFDPSAVPAARGRLRAYRRPRRPGG